MSCGKRSERNFVFRGSFFAHTFYTLMQEKMTGSPDFDKSRAEESVY